MRERGLLGERERGLWPKYVAIMLVLPSCGDGGGGHPCCLGIELSCLPGWALSKCPLELVVMLMRWQLSTQSVKSRLLSLPPPGNFINKSLDLFQEEFQGFSVCVCFQKHNNFTCRLVCKLPSNLWGGMRAGHWKDKVEAPPGRAGPGWARKPAVSRAVGARLCSWLCYPASQTPIGPRLRLLGPLPHPWALPVFSTRFSQSAGVLK